MKNIEFHQISPKSGYSFITLFYLLCVPLFDTFHFFSVLSPYFLLSLSFSHMVTQWSHQMTDCPPTPRITHGSINQSLGHAIACACTNTHRCWSALNVCVWVCIHLFGTSLWQGCSGSCHQLDLIYRQILRVCFYEQNYACIYLCVY